MTYFSVCLKIISIGDTSRVVSCMLVLRLRSSGAATTTYGSAWTTNGASSLNDLLYTIVRGYNISAVTVGALIQS